MRYVLPAIMPFSLSAAYTNERCPPPLPVPIHQAACSDSAPAPDGSGAPRDLGFEIMAGAVASSLPDLPHSLIHR